MVWFKMVLLLGVEDEILVMMFVSSGSGTSLYSGLLDAFLWMSNCDNGLATDGWLLK